MDPFVSGMLILEQYIEIYLIHHPPPPPQHHHQHPLTPLIVPMYLMFLWLSGSPQMSSHCLLPMTELLKYGL